MCADLLRHPAVVSLLCTMLKYPLPPKISIQIPVPPVLGSWIRPCAKSGAKGFFAQQIAELPPSLLDLQEATLLPNNMTENDVVVIGGGNTLFVVNRWHQIGLLPHLKPARDRGCILAEGLAGVIYWFDGGSFDSMDPDTYQTALLEKFGGVGKVSKMKVALHRQLKWISNLGSTFELQAWDSCQDCCVRIMTACKAMGSQGPMILTKCCCNMRANW
jgi:hypothetical protein